MKWILDWASFLHPYAIAVLCLLLILLLNSGCAAAGGQSAAATRSFVTTGTSTAAGAYIGAKEGNGKARNAAVGAAAGFVVGETVNFFSNKAQREAYLAGYEKGQSNAVKQQYWIARDNQRARTDDGYEESLYQIEVPQSDHDGVRREPTTRVIRVVLPKERSGT